METVGRKTVWVSRCPLHNQTFGRGASKEDADAAAVTAAWESQK
jgi:hypothetical protein